MCEVLRYYEKLFFCFLENNRNYRIVIRCFVLRTRSFFIFDMDYFFKKKYFIPLIFRDHGGFPVDLLQSFFFSSSCLFRTLGSLVDAAAGEHIDIYTQLAVMFN